MTASLQLQLYAMVHQHNETEITTHHPGLMHSLLVSSAGVGCIWRGDNSVGGLLLKSVIKQLTLHIHMIIMPIELPGIVVPPHVLMPAVTY